MSDLFGSQWDDTAYHSVNGVTYIRYDLVGAMIDKLDELQQPLQDACAKLDETIGQIQFTIEDLRDDESSDKVDEL